MGDADPVFSTWGVWLNSDDPLWRFCDATMHWDCYATWSHRSRFADTYFQFWTKADENNPYWYRAYFDGDILVTVNPDEFVRSAWVYLRSTGSRISVKLFEWERWLASGEEPVHPVYDDAVNCARQVLATAVPTVDALLGRINANP